MVIDRSSAVARHILNIDSLITEHSASELVAPNKQRSVGDHKPASDFGGRTHAPSSRTAQQAAFRKSKVTERFRSGPSKIPKTAFDSPKSPPRSRPDRA
jgi:hypothetical protein